MTTLQEDAEAFQKAWREFVLKGHSGAKNRSIR
jgi:hypothetical protein